MDRARLLDLLDRLERVVTKTCEIPIPEVQNHPSRPIHRTSHGLVHISVILKNIVFEIPKRKDAA